MNIPYVIKTSGVSSSLSRWKEANENYIFSLKKNEMFKALLKKMQQYLSAQLNKTPLSSATSDADKRYSDNKLCVFSNWQ